MTARVGLAFGLVLLASAAGSDPARAQGVWNELQAWERAAPAHEAEQQAMSARAQAAFAPCKGEKSPCRTQLVEQGWRVTFSSFEPLGIDIGLAINLLELEGQQQICTTFIAHDDAEHERPCRGMAPSSDMVKN